MIKTPVREINKIGQNPPIIRLQRDNRVDRKART
jgi:hypothetical protein